MKKEKILSILNNIDMKTFVEQNLTAYKIMQQISPKLGEANTPSKTAITSYIKNHFNLQWDTKTKTWLSYKKDENSNIKKKKKRKPNIAKNIIISHESDLINNDIPQECNEENFISGNLSDLHKQKSYTKEGISSESSSVIKNEDKNNTISNTNSNPNDQQSMKLKENKINSKVDSTAPLQGLKDELINPSEYAEHITAMGTNKYSLSISCFILELVEQRISKKYNLNRKGNRSKMIQLALLEYLRLTK